MSACRTDPAGICLPVAVTVVEKTAVALSRPGIERVASVGSVPSVQAETIIGIKNIATHTSALTENYADGLAFLAFSPYKQLKDSVNPSLFQTVPVPSKRTPRLPQTQRGHRNPVYVR